MVSDGTEFAVGDIERLFEDAGRNTKAKHEKWEKYYNRRRRDVQIKVNDWALIATHPLSSATRKVVAKFKPKFEGPYRILNVKNIIVVVWKAGKRLTVNVDKVRIYRHRKCDETEIGTGSADNGSLRDESSGFDKVQRRSNESQNGKKKASDVKLELDEKGLSFKNDQGESHKNKTNNRVPLMRSIPSSYSEKSRRIKISENEMLGYKRSRESGSSEPNRKFRKNYNYRVSKRALSSNNSGLQKYRRKRHEQDKVAVSRYNLIPRGGREVESRLAIERKTQQGGSVRFRKGRGRNNSLYIEERTSSSNRNTRRGGDQQRQDQERKGAHTRKSHYPWRSW
ncbi:uncharacterized protein TNCV_760401 [Trichonephila clavipes]|nr:uncharacterized protein TNCV_760401 [Trichonephila clavipes]